VTDQEIIEKLRGLMKESSQEDVNWDDMGPESAIDSLGFDSLSILDLTYDIQQEFGIDFEAEEMVKVATVRDMVEFLKTKSV
jgi:acyl carrier protein